MAHGALGRAARACISLAAPEEGLSLVGADGHELLWLDRLDDLPEPARTLVREELAVREFVPTISKIVKVSSFSTPAPGMWRPIAARPPWC